MFTRSLVVLSLFACMAFAPPPQSSEAARLEANKALVARFFEEVWSTGDLSRRDDFLAIDYRGHVGGPDAVDREGWTAFFQAFRTAFPDARFTVEDRVAEGDRVAARLTMRGTHLGSLNGIPATGRTITVTGMSIERVVDGRIVEGWNENDALGLMQQLGVLPPPAD